MRIAIFVMKYLRVSYSRAAILFHPGWLFKVRRGNTAFPVVFPVGGASLVASPLRSDYPSYAPGASMSSSVWFSF